jgi:hypothetical protein
MGNAEKKEIAGILEEGLDAVHRALRGIEDQTAQRRPRPDAWSVLECVEHITLTEAALLARLNEAKPVGASREDRAREARFQDLALNRQRRIEAPERVVSQGRCQTVAEAYGHFQAQRDETLRFVEEFGGDLHSWVTIHPLITRPVNCYEMLLLMALHPRRHAQQIAEIREQLSHGGSQIE